MMHYEVVIAQGVLAALEAAQLNSADVELLKASFMCSPEETMEQPPDRFRADTFIAIQKLRDGIARSEPADVLKDLRTHAVALATIWLQARS